MVAAVEALAVHYPHSHGAWWPIFPIFWILFFVGIFWLLRRRGCGWSGSRTGESVLGERYARGEISENEYRERKRVLRERAR